MATLLALAAFSMIASQVTETVGLATERMAGSKMDRIACAGKDSNLAFSVSYRSLAVSTKDQWELLTSDSLVHHHRLCPTRIACQHWH